MICISFFTSCILKLLLSTYMFIIVMSSRYTGPFIIRKYLSFPPLVILLVLKSILSDTNIAFQFSCAQCLHDIFFPFFCFLVFKVYLLQAAYNWVLFFIYSITLCLLIEAFSPVTFKIVTYRYIFIAICYLFCGCFYRVSLILLLLCFMVCWLSLVIYFDPLLFILCISVTDF